MLQKWLDRLGRVYEIVIIGLLAALVVIGGLQVTNRFIFNRSLSWSEEFQRFTFIWIVFLGIPIGYRRGKHIGMEVFVKKLAFPFRFALSLMAHVLWLALGTAITVFTWKIMQVARFQTSPGLGLSMDRVYLGLFLGGAYLTLLALSEIWRALRTGRADPRFDRDLLEEARMEAGLQPERE